jgi:hypothetical protein
MLEKAIEHWLTSVGELGYMPAFVNALTAHGETVLAVSRHRSLEAGKDVVTRDASGGLRAYQLKGGDIDIRKWRSIVGELEDLVRLPVRVGNPDPATPHRSFLVTNGRVVDEVVVVLREWNDRLEGLGYGRLELVQREELLKMFLDLSATFIPVEPRVARDLFDTYCGDGQDMLDREKFSDLLWRIAFSRESPSPAEWTNAVAGSVLATAFVLRPYSNANNHYAMFEGWTLLAGALSRYQAIHGERDAAVLRRALGLAWDEAEAALETLLQEASKRENLLEGAWPGDGGDVYRARATIILGAAAAGEIVRLWRDAKAVVRAEVVALIEKHSKYLWYWGDAAMPSFLAIAKVLECAGKRADGERLALGILDGILTRNSRDGDDSGALPSSYYTAEDVLMDAVGVAELDKRIPRTEFLGQSWGLGMVVHWLVRRDKRAELTDRWARITRIRVKSFEPDGPREFWRFRAEKGVNRYGFFRAAESWARLRKEARDLPESRFVWPLWGARVLLYCLAAPFRWSVPLAALVDANVDCGRSVSLGSGAQS